MILLLTTVSVTFRSQITTLAYLHFAIFFSCLSTETFEVDISNTKKLLEGERGQKILEKDIIVSGPFAGLMTIH